MGRTRTRSAPTGLTLDTGALIALDRGDGRMIALLNQSLPCDKSVGDKPLASRDAEGRFHA